MDHAPRASELTAEIARLRARLGAVQLANSIKLSERIGRNEAKVLIDLMLVYGPPPVEIVTRARAIAEATHLDVGAVRKAIRKFIDAGIFRLEDWTDSGEIRFEIEQDDKEDGEEEEEE